MWLVGALLAWLGLLRASVMLGTRSLSAFEAFQIAFQPHPHHQIAAIKIDYPPPAHFSETQEWLCLWCRWEDTFDQSITRTSFILMLEQLSTQMHPNHLDSFGHARREY